MPHDPCVYNQSPHFSRGPAQNLQKLDQIEAGSHIQSFPSFREDEDFNRQGNVRVMGIVYSTNMDAASFVVLVDQDGAVIDYCRMVHFTKPGFGPQAQLKKFVERRRPHVLRHSRLSPAG
ncbi:unnamed protein product [Cylicocyclus nassatus]|uniref:Uncharacterized protein n=1 Tax=Cylicocyclus nassatus TaxID=53992 RepID=A0AA36DR23_CYLNA|nr:unnamed protein product [Cylicocyclus nassatus]